MKWICKYCVSPCLVSMMGCNSPPIGCVLGGKTTIPRWDPVDEQSTKPVLGRCACTYRPVNPPHLAVVNLSEMTENMAALKERVEALEREAQHAGPYAAALDHLNLREQVKKLQINLDVHTHCAGPAIYQGRGE